MTASGSSSTASYIWSNGETTQSIEITTSGTYSVSAVSENGCTSDESNPVIVTVLNDTIPEQPTIMISGDTEFCQGESTTLSAPAGYDSYYWSNGQNTQSIEVSFSGVYSVQVGNASNCVSIPSQQVTITVNFTPPQPFIQANGDLLASSSPTGNQWFFNGNPIPGATDQFYTATESGFYSLQVTLNGCPSPMSSLYNHTLVSIDMVNTDNKSITIFPNPATTVLKRQLSRQQ